MIIRDQLGMTIVDISAVTIVDVVRDEQIKWQLIGTIDIDRDNFWLLAEYNTKITAQAVLREIYQNASQGKSTDLCSPLPA